MSNFKNQSSINVHLHHHPILLLNIGDESATSQKIACKDKMQQQVPINFASTDALWKYPYFISSLDLERYLCVFS